MTSPLVRARSVHADEQRSVTLFAVAPSRRHAIAPSRESEGLSA
jgi:hypothetical protein